MRGYEIFKDWDMLFEDIDAVKKAADTNLQIAKQRKQQVKVKSTQDNLNAQRKRLADITKQVTPTL